MHTIDCYSVKGHALTHRAYTHGEKVKFLKELFGLVGVMWKGLAEGQALKIEVKVVK